MALYLSMLEEDVKKTYVRLNIMQPEQINVEKIASAFNIYLHYEEAGDRMFCIDGGYSIVLDNRLSPERQWEDFAHELCHILKHYGNQFVMNKMFRYRKSFRQTILCIISAFQLSCFQKSIYPAYNLKL